MVTSHTACAVAATEPSSVLPVRFRTWLGDDPSPKFVALLVLFTFPAVLYIHNFSMTDPDFGWHLRAGEWILSNHTVPFTDPFSIYGAGKPWYDYSWLFDIFFALVYRAFGLIGFALLEVALRIAIPVCIYRLARTLELSFWPSVAATAAGAYSFTSIFLLWASIHIQFIHGLIILAIFAFEPLLNLAFRYRPAPAALPAKSMWIL